MSYNPQVGGCEIPVRASGTSLSTSFETPDGTTRGVPIRLGNWNQLLLHCDVTLNTATSVEVKIQAANPKDDSTATGAPAAASTLWFDLPYQTAGTITAGLATVPTGSYAPQFTATGRWIVSVPCAYKFVRVLAKTTGGPGTTTLTVTASQAMA